MHCVGPYVASQQRTPTSLYKAAHIQGGPYSPEAAHFGGSGHGTAEQPVSCFPTP